MPLRYRRFYDISLSERILNTAFLLTMGVGYLFALVNLYYTHQSRDGSPGLSIEDIAVAYHGSHDKTRLEAAINGIMEPNLKYKSDKDVILKWIHSGADEPEYMEKVAPILNRDCITCHSPERNPSLPNLTTYEGAAAVAHGGAAALPALVRVSHIHLFGIAFILYFIGRIFILTDMNVTVKRIAVTIPFLAMLLDVMSWYVTRYFPGFAYVVVFTGALMGLSIGLQILVSLYQMWSHRVHPVNLSEPLEKRAARCRTLIEEFGHVVQKHHDGWTVSSPSGAHYFIKSVQELERYARQLEINYQQSD